MKVRNKTEFPFAPLLGRVNFPHYSVTCTVKGTFTLKPGGVLEPLQEQPQFAGDEPSKAERPECLYAADLAPFKPKADVLLRATCHNLRAATTCMVKFAVGGWSKQLAVIGNRRWDKGMVFNKMGEPEEFNTVELSWANAFGGAGFERNPAGKGRKDGMLPNVEDPAELIKSPGNQPLPAGYGPIERTWKPRSGKLGTYDKKWRKERWPAFPKDLDWTYFNAAPEDQQLEFLHGDEQITLTNMHPEHPELTTRLPGLRTRCVLRRKESEGLSEHDVPMNLDTVYVDAHRMLVTLVWRGVCNIREEEGEDAHDVLVFSEALDSRAATLDEVRPWFEEDPEEALPPEEPLVVDTAMMEGEALAAAMDKEGAATLANMNKLSPIALSMAPVLFEGFGQMRGSMQQLASKLKAAGRTVPPELTQAMHDFEHNPDMKEAEQELMIASALALIPPALKPTRAKLAAAIKKGETPDRDFAGDDLSGEDLSGADLNQANFTGANLAGTIFTGCKLDGAMFAEANLAGANFAGVKADRVDFTAANLENADFSGAGITFAEFSQAKGKGQKFAKAELPGAMFADASLVDADFEGTQLKEADFSRSDLTGAKFAKAGLSEASFYAVKAEGVSFKACKGSALRGADANFKGADFEESDLPGAIFENANLEGANFRFAMLKGAMFTSANLAKAVLFGAVVRQASLRKANMAGAQAGNADFFQCDFEKSNLSDASLITSNCFEAAFRDANTKGTDFTETNLKMTLLA